MGESSTSHNSGLPVEKLDPTPTFMGTVSGKPIVQEVIGLGLGTARGLAIVNCHYKVTLDPMFMETVTGKDGPSRTAEINGRIESGENMVAKLPLDKDGKPFWPTEQSDDEDNEKGPPPKVSAKVIKKPRLAQRARKTKKKMGRK